MSGGHLFSRAGQWFLKTIRVQLIISALSLPILVAWSIPISYLSVIGNIIFIPFLSLFLFLASCLFFSELFLIPNGLLIKLLHWLINAYWFCLNSCMWVKPVYIEKKYFFLCIIVMLFIWFMYKTYMWTSWYSILIYLFLYSGFIYYSRPITPINAVKVIGEDNFHVHAAFKKGSCIVIDQGLMGKSAQSMYFMEFVLAKQLYALYRADVIHHLVVCSYTAWSFYAYERLFSLIMVKNIYLPRWKGFIPSPLYRAYRKMVRSAKKNGCMVHHIEQPVLLKNEQADTLAKIVIHSDPLAKGPEAVIYPLKVTTDDGQVFLEVTR